MVSERQGVPPVHIIQESDPSMTLDECRQCKYHTSFYCGAVHCGFDKNIVSITVVMNPKKKIQVLSACPRER
jgi:hypothetical protein